MNTPMSDTAVHERLTALERELENTVATVRRNDARLRALEGGVPGASSARRTPSPRPPLPVSDIPPVALQRGAATAAQTGTAATATPTARRGPDAAVLSDFLGGRALAWLGGIVTLLGIVLLLALAIAHGWIGPEARVGLAAAASAALIGAGCRLHARRGRTEAAAAMVGAGTAGAFATLIVAGEVYRLIPPLAGVAGSMLVGALATALAIRWAGRAVAGLGLAGGLLSPVLVGAPSDAATVAVVGVGAVCAIWVVVWRRWGRLALVTVMLSVPEWARWLADDHSRLADVAVLAAFGLLGAAGALAAGSRAPGHRPARAAAALVVLNAIMMGVAGRLALGAVGGALWLAAMALVHAGAALWRRPRLTVDDTVRRLVVAVAVVCADVALGLALDGVAQAAAWGASALGFAWLVRRVGPQTRDGVWLEAGLGIHVALGVTRALIELPPARLGDGAQLAPLACTAILALACVGSSRLAGSGRAVWREFLAGLGLLAIGYLTAASVHGAVLVAAWAAEAAALGQIAARTQDRVARAGALAFLTAATVHTAIAEVPPMAFVDGVPGLGAAALAIGATAAAALRIGLTAGHDPRLRLPLLAGAALAPLLLASVTIISVFQPAAGAQDVTVLALGVRQQGQVLLSALWGAAGVAALIAGLRRNLPALRIGALGLLLATAAKVFLYDLSALTSIYRVLSFFVVGGLLLGGAFAYQRLRPPAPPDLRAVHSSQR